MITILRMASYPTIEESGRGLHCYEISKTKKTKVIYLTWFKKNSTPFVVPPNVKLYIRKFYTSENPKNSNLIIKFFFSIYRIYRIFTFSLNGVYLLLKYRVNIVHIHSPMFILVSCIGYLLRKKNYITFHGEDFFKIKDKNWYKILSKCIDRVFSISPRYIKTLKRIHNREIIQIYNGIDTSVYQNLNLVRKKQILAVANFKKQKGLKFLIEGFSLFLKNNQKLNHYKLIIAGKGILYNQINEMINKKKLNDNIFLVGQKNRNQLIELYNNSEIFILPSIWEGFAKVLVEAMACGCKVISTKVDSAPIVLDNWGYMINHSNSKEISVTIKELINNKSYPFEKQKKSLKKFTWDFVRSIYNKQLKLTK